MNQNLVQIWPLDLHIIVGNISQSLDKVKIDFPPLDHKSDRWMPLQKHEWNMGHRIVKTSNLTIRWIFKIFKKTLKKIVDFFHFSALLCTSLHDWFNCQFIGSKPIYHWYFNDISDIFPKFLPFDNQFSKSFWGHPISDMSVKYRQ